MKADPTIQRRLLSLAEIDAELSRTMHRRRNLPEIEQIQTVEQQVRAKQDAVTAATTALNDHARLMKKQETEIDQVQARTQRDRGLLEGGTLSAKQLTDVQHELETLGRRQVILEDVLLELMEQREALEANVAHAQVELDKAQESLAKASSQRDEVFADLDTIEARRSQERKLLIAQFPEDLLAVYENVRSHKGIGAALLRSRRCGACRIELDRIAFAKVKEAAENEVTRCEECGAIMVRTAESGL